MYKKQHSSPVLCMMCSFLLMCTGGYAQLERVYNIEEAILSTSDRTYLTLGQGVGNYKTPYGTRSLTPLIFEAQVAPDFFVNLSQSKTVGMAFFPKIVVRMFNQKSLPVKTPSYMPAILLYHRVNNDFTKKLFRAVSSRDHLTILTYRFIHHSNGQDGEFLIPGSDSVNYTNGNFSTNAVEAGFSWSVMDSIEVRKAFANGRIAYERQLELERETQLNTTYYYNKLTLENHINYSEKIKIDITYAFMWGRPRFRPRSSLDVFVAVRPFSKPSNFSLFVRGYVGPDYYNIYYENQLRSVNIGIIADPLRIPVIKKMKK